MMVWRPLPRGVGSPTGSHKSSKFLGRASAPPCADSCIYSSKTMVIFRRAAVASLFLLMGACSVGEVPTGGITDAPPGGGGTPDQTFTAMIAPLVSRCVGCHSGAQNPTLTSYASLQTKYKTKPGMTNI